MAELKGAALREKETQLQGLTKTIRDLYASLGDLQSSGLVGSSTTRYFDILGEFINSSTIRSVTLPEPSRVLGEFQGSGNEFSRLFSFLRERSYEVDLLKDKLINSEKASLVREYSGVDAERTIAALRAENADLSRQIDQLRSSSSNSASSNDAKVRELELKLKTANSRIQ